MTLRAYSGRQKENIIVYDNDDTAFDYFYNRFDSFLENTICKIEPQRMKKLTSENLVSDNPIIVGVVETKNTIYVDTTMEDDTEDFDGYYATNKENMKAILDKYTETMEKSFFESKADARNVLALLLKSVRVLLILISFLCIRISKNLYHIPNSVLNQI